MLDFANLVSSLPGAAAAILRIRTPSVITEFSGMFIFFPARTVIFLILI